MYFISKHSLCCQGEIKLQPKSMHTLKFECSHTACLIRIILSNHLSKKTYLLTQLAFKACW